MDRRSYSISVYALRLVNDDLIMDISVTQKQSQNGHGHGSSSPHDSVENMRPSDDENNSTSTIDENNSGSKPKKIKVRDITEMTEGSKSTRKPKKGTYDKNSETLWSVVLYKFLGQVRNL